MLLRYPYACRRPTLLGSIALSTLGSIIHGKLGISFKLACPGTTYFELYARCTNVKAVCNEAPHHTVEGITLLPKDSANTQLTLLS